MTKLNFKGLNRRKKRAEERRNSITRAALQVLRQKGYDQTTMQDIADAADLSPSSVYYYFDSKIAILEEAFNSLDREIAEETETGKFQNTTQFDSLARIIERLNYFKEVNLVSILAEAEHNPDLRPRITKMVGYIQKEVSRRMQVLQDQKLLNGISADMAAQMILSMGFGALILSGFKLEEDSANINVEEILNKFNTLLLSNNTNSTEQERV